MGRNSRTETTEKLAAVSRELAIEYRHVADLTPFPGNSRKHHKKQVRQIAKSIEVFGFNVPLLINAHSQVMAGHGRLLACKLLGITEVPTIRLEHLTETQARAFTIADNRLNENSEWDYQLLGEQLKILSEIDLDFNVEVTGFELGEIDLFITNLPPSTEGTLSRDEVVPDFDGRPVVTRAGDCWTLGRHRLYCGDAQNPSAYATLMQEQRAEMVFATPPCRDPVTKFGTASDEMGGSRSADFLRTVLTHLATNSVDGALNLVCIDWRYSAELLAAAKSVYTEFKNLCVWVKDTAGKGSLYCNQHELVFVFKVGKKPHGNNVRVGRYGRHRTDVWSCRPAKSRRSGEEDFSGVHKRRKPIDMVADAILDCTAREQIVLDPFLGGGTTLIAAERTGRVCYGMELDPHYVDITVRRWQSYTGRIARESTGRSFDDIEKELHR
jgi:DNA modification methylase